LPTAIPLPHWIMMKYLMKSGKIIFIKMDNERHGFNLPAGNPSGNMAGRVKDGSLSVIE